MLLFVIGAKLFLAVGMELLQEAGRGRLRGCFELRVLGIKLRQEAERVIAGSAPGELPRCESVRSLAGACRADAEVTKLGLELE